MQAIGAGTNFERVLLGRDQSQEELVDFAGAFGISGQFGHEVKGDAITPSVGERVEQRLARFAMDVTDGEGPFDTDDFVDEVALAGCEIAQLEFGVSVTAAADTQESSHQQVDGPK